MEEDIKQAMNWLAGLDIHSEYEATNKELILSTIENLINKYKEQEKIIELMHEDMKLEGYLTMSKEELYEYYRKRIKLESEEK